MLTSWDQSRKGILFAAGFICSNNTDCGDNKDIEWTTQMEKHNIVVTLAFFLPLVLSYLGVCEEATHLSLSPEP